jgi:hypothetical protein
MVTSTPPAVPAAIVVVSQVSEGPQKAYEIRNEISRETSDTAPQTTSQSR